MSHSELHHGRGDHVGRGFDPSRFYVLDGGFGSTLSAFFTPSSSSNVLWSSEALMTAPQAVVEVHKQFVEAGASIITTNSYQCHLDLLKAHYVMDDEEGRSVLKKSVDLAQQAVKEIHGSKVCLIAGSVGPYGSFLADGSEYNGHYGSTMSCEELEHFHFDKIRLLHHYGVDVIALETVPCVKEALSLLNLVDSIPGCRCFITFQCRDDQHLADGTSFREAVRSVVLHKAFKEKVLALGVNCVKPSYVTPLLKVANKINNRSFFVDNGLSPDMRCKPYIVYPNSGETWDAGNKVFVGDTYSDEILSSMKEWMILGANVIGGCCRVEPNQIAAIRRRMDECLLDVLQARRQRAKLLQRTTEPKWSDIEKRLRQLAVKARQQRKRKAPTGDEINDASNQDDQSEVDIFGDLPPFVLVPGQTHQKTIDAHLQRLLRHLKFELIEDDEENQLNEANNKKCLPLYGFWNSNESLLEAAKEFSIERDLTVEGDESDCGRFPSSLLPLESVDTFVAKLVSMGEKGEWDDMRRMLNPQNTDTD